MPEVGSELRISVDNHTRYHSQYGEYVVVRLFDAPEFGTHRSDMGFDASVLSISYENGETENFLAVKLPAYFNTKDLGKGKVSKEQVERFMRGNYEAFLDPLFRGPLSSDKISEPLDHYASAQHI